MSLARKLVIPALVSLLPAWTPPQALANEVQPYIDQLRRKLPSQGNPTDWDSAESESYINALKGKMKDDERTGSTEESYTERIRRSLPPQREGGGAESFLETEKARLGPPSEESAIAAVNENRSQLKLKREGKIRHALGFKLGAAMNRDVTNGDSPLTFEELYGTGWAPDFSLFYEFQPIHSPWLGSFGLVVGGGISTHSGKGQFSVGGLPKGWNPSEKFESRSLTSFNFLTAPLSLGASYRFKLFHFLQPYVHFAPTALFYQESRSDYDSTMRGMSGSLLTSGGVNIMMDWMSGGSAWDLYDVWGIKHFYLTLDYSKLTAVMGDVAFNSSGVSAGFTFEF